MILFLLAQAAATPVSAEQSRFDECVAIVAADPKRAIDVADSWRLAGGGAPARRCQALGYAAQERWLPAATAFEAAAREAEKSQDPETAAIWVQAGNARLAGGDYPAARTAFDAALARGMLTDGALGEAYLDRARVAVAMNDSPAARTDIDRALKLVPADPLAWLLSATLARRQSDLARARKDIAEASSRSPDDASVALEAGNIAMLSGVPQAARIAWTAAVTYQPGSDAARAAQASLATMPKDEK